MMRSENKQMIEHIDVRLLYTSTSTGVRLYERVSARAHFIWLWIIEINIHIVAHIQCKIVLLLMYSF